MADTLREYLIKLGFGVDDASYKKWRDSVAAGAKSIAEFGAEVTATVAAIEAGVTRVARQFEGLNYASQRTTATVQSINAIEFAAKQVGITSETARGMVEGLAGAMRTQPGLKGLLNQGYGISETDPTKILPQLIEKLKSQFGDKNYFAAAKVGELFGLDEQSFRQMWANLDKFKAAMDDSLKRQQEAGTGAKETADAFLNFSRTLNLLEDNLGNFKTRIAQDFLEPAQRALEIINNLITSVSKLDKESKGSVGFWGTLLASAGGVWAGKKVLGKVFGMFGGGGAATATGTGTGVGGAAPAAAEGGWLARVLTFVFTRFIDKLVLALGILVATTVEAQGGVPLYVRNPKTGELEANPDAIRKNLIPGLRDKPGAEPQGESDAKHLNLDDEPFDWNHWAERRTRNSFSAPRPGSTPVTVNQETNVTVTGVSDPAAAAEEVRGSQGRVNRDLGDVVRDTVGAFR